MRPGVQAKARFVAAVLTAIAGSAAEAAVVPELGGDDAARSLERTVDEARGIEMVKRAGLEAWRIHHEREAQS